MVTLVDSLRNCECRFLLPVLGPQQLSIQAGPRSWMEMDHKQRQTNAECCEVLSAMETTKWVKGMWSVEGRAGSQRALHPMRSGKATGLWCLEGGSLWATQRARKRTSTAEGRETLSPSVLRAQEKQGGPRGPRRGWRGQFPPWNVKLMWYHLLRNCWTGLCKNTGL